MDEKPETRTCCLLPFAFCLMMNWSPENFEREALQQVFDLLATPLISIGDTTISLGSVLKVMLSLLIVIFISTTVKVFLKKQVLEKFKIDDGNQEIISTIVSYAISLLGFLVILETTGFNLASLTVIIGALGVGIGFGLEEVTRNFISGLFLLIERIVKVGDFIEADGLCGYVKAISLRSTILRTRQGADVIIPNSKIIESRIVNWSLENFTGRIDVPVEVAYGSDLVLVTEALLNAAYLEKSILDEPAPEVIFVGFGDSALEFELWVWVNRIDLSRQIKSGLNFNIEYCLRQQGIQIPFPQRDLWLRNPEDLKSNGNQGGSNQLEQLTLSKSLRQSERSRSLKELLQKTVYFQNCNDLQLRNLMAMGQRKTLYESEILFRPGESSDTFYLILSGSVKSVDEKLGEILQTSHTGHFFGEAEVMLGIPRQTTLEALEDTTLFAIKTTALKQLLEELPDLAGVIAEELTTEQTILEQHQQRLRELGLLEETKDRQTFIKWIVQRMGKIFNLRKGGNG